LNWTLPTTNAWQHAKLKERSPYILPLIVFSQFAGTSLWFAGNAILPDIQLQLGVHGSHAGTITSMVQLGFIAGTLVFSVFSVADRFSSSRVFFFSTVLAAFANVAIIWLGSSLEAIYILRFITGFFLAGVYPVGMKIAADWFAQGLGKALGYLVGALVLGTSLPYLLKSGIHALPAKEVLIFTSAFAVCGGLVTLLFVGDGPSRKTLNRFQPGLLIRIFRSADFRSAAFGYFGHMWELYTLWAFLPALLGAYMGRGGGQLNIALWSFILIAMGAVGCVVGGYLSQRIGSARVAFFALLISACCCLASSGFFHVPVAVFLGLMICWGLAVTADSPQFSALVAQTAIPEFKGTALTLVTSIGFAITIGSIQIMGYALDRWNEPQKLFTILSIGPIIGLFFLFPLVRRRKINIS
jgi:MFS family permease